MYRFDLNAQLRQLHSHFPSTTLKPVIGITGNYGELTCKLAEGYYKQVEAAGGSPLIIPPLTDAGVIVSTLERIDALLLTGGADINPLYLGEQPQQALGGINDERDLPELLITRLAYNRQMPILGICRGIQTLAAALGGQLYQDIGHIAHLKHSQDAGRSVATHTVDLVPGSTIATLYACPPSSCTPPTSSCAPPSSSCATPSSSLGLGVGDGIAVAPSIAVNSFHHQAVSSPGPHLRVTATAPDGIIEAVESTDHKPIMAVQWHPECMGADGLPLFGWLVAEARLYSETRHLHRRVLTLDTHCDTPMLFPQGIDFSTRDDRILVDLHKMTEGCLDATIMVAYLPQAGWAKEGDRWLPNADGLTPKGYADHIFDEIGRIVAHNADSIAFARTPDELYSNKRQGRKSIMLGIENGLALEGRLDHLQHFARRGIVYVTLCHNGDNDICDAAVRTEHTHGGISHFGEQVIGEMNRLGLLVDLSHGGEKSFYDALDISRLPIVCSHSSARALCDHPRNLTDDQMRALAAKGGVCQITLYPGFLRTDGQATIADALQHLDHAISIMGIDHVGLGTDFDGDGGVPGMADASDYLNFTRHLLRRRYAETDIRLICGGNFMRVMQQVQDAQH